MIFKKRKQQPIFSALSELKKEEPVKSSVKSGAEERVVENNVPVERKITSAAWEDKNDSLPGPNGQGVVLEPFEANDFVHIEPGSFMMGSEEEEFGRHEDEVLHEVTLTHGFYIQVTLVTQKQWKAIMGNNPSSFAGLNLGQPVDGVSWNDCQQFIKRLNSLGHHKYRLPTEAEWEYVCRAGTSTAFCDGNIDISEDGRDSKLDEVAWYNANSAGKTHPVAQKSPNAWGIYDMHGNLCEWCEDWYENYLARPQIDPINTTVGSCRASRGGCWVSTAQNCRSASRFSWPPDHRSDFIGFRLVREKS